jgi:hypothetical protein
MKLLLLVLLLGLLLPESLFAQSPPGVRKIGPKGGGACTSARDCQLAGDCTGGKCVCDPGWTGPLCSMLDLAPLDVGFKGGAWNTELSPHSSWGAAPLHIDGKYHGWFNQLPAKCGLSSWLPGSYIQHGVSDSPLGPFKLVNDTPSAPPPDGKRDPLSGPGQASFATNPHVTYVKSEKRFLLFFNGRAWPANDLTNCWPSDNKTDTDGSHYHGGGACTSDKDCAGAFAGTDAHQGGAANICGTDGRCSCEHHSMGSHCQIITESTCPQLFCCLSLADCGQRAKTLRSSATANEWIRLTMYHSGQCRSLALSTRSMDGAAS